MRYLFIIQGEGRGHMTQALSLAAMLRRQGHEIVQVLVGNSPNHRIPDFFFERINAPVQTFDAPRFSFSGSRVNLLYTVFSNFAPARLVTFIRSMRTIRETIEKQRPDIIVNFYEMLSGLAVKRYRIKVPMIGIGHQFLLLHENYPHGRQFGIKGWLLRLHVRLSAQGCSRLLALSFYPMPDDKTRSISVVPPLLREEIRECSPVTEENFILGYMINNSYATQILSWSRTHPEQHIHVFWDNKDRPETWQAGNNLTFHKIDDKLFLEFMRRCKGYITTAGFESVCEAMFLGKPLMLIPSHIEQRVNACDASSIGAGTISESFDLTRFIDFIEQSEFDNGSFRTWVAESDAKFIHLTYDNYGKHLYQPGVKLAFIQRASHAGSA